MYGRMEGMAPYITYLYSVLLFRYSNMELIFATETGFIFSCEGLLTTLYQLLEVQVIFINEIRIACMSSWGSKIHIT